MINGFARLTDKRIVKVCFPVNGHNLRYIFQSDGVELTLVISDYY